MFIRTCCLLFVLLFSGCGQKTLPARQEEKKPLVLVSIAPYQFLVEQIGKGMIETKTIIPSGSNPHVYEPTSKQVLEIAQGTIWFRIGEPFENKVISFLEYRNPRLAICDLREGIELLSSDHTQCAHSSHDHLDRHIWMSPRLASQQAKQIAEVLSKHFPEKKEFFEQNLQKCLTELEMLDTEIDHLLAPLQERIFVVSHPAFAYFCRDYHFEQLSVEEEGKDPRPRHLEEMMEKARLKHAEIALALPQYNNKGAQIIAERLHVPIRMIDPYAHNYFETMRTLAHLIANPRGINENNS